MLLVPVLAGLVPAQGGVPTDQIRQTTDAILAIAQDPELQGPGKAEDRQSRMKSAAAARFDWASMARSAVGKHWSELSGEQQAEFTGVFSELIENTYMSKVEGYSGERILYKGDKVEGAYGVVDVVVVTLRGTDIPVSYRVISRGAEWLIYDVSIEGVSLVNNYRSQIGAILNRSSYDELLRRIQAKIAAAPPQAEESGAAATRPATTAGDAL
jgi:phospholipid transport system substrate-binding protein